MNAYHGKDTLKMQFVRTALEHEEADAYVKGLYWAEAEKRGCNIGCWTKAETGLHEALAVEMSVPVDLLHLSDGLFEALPDPYFKSWSRRFAGAIPVGADLSQVGGELLSWMLCHDEWGLKVLSNNSALRCLFRDMSHYVKNTWAAPEALNFEVEAMRLSLGKWKSWDEHALRDMRAIRAALELWRTRPNDEKALARSAWSARAAWSAWENYTLAQSEALIEMLKRAPSLVLA